MVWQWSPSVIAELAASATLLLLAVYLPWRDFNRQARLTGATLIFVCALWMMSHAMEIGLPAASYKESLVGVQLVLGMVALTFWLLYILHYLGPRKLLTWRVYILSSIMPLIAILALSTNHIYSLMWTGIGLDSQNPYLPLQPSYGMMYWICMVYIALLTLVGSILIIQNIIRHRHSYSRESTYLLVAAVLPLLVAFIEVSGLLSSFRISVGLTPWAACIGAVILRLSLPRFRLEQVIPIARDVIFERIGDCILVLDMQNRVVDLNPAAEQLLGCKISDALGLSIERIWPQQATPMMSFDRMAKAGEELVLERGGEQRTYDLRISTMGNSSGSPTNQVVLLSDITKRKRAEEALRESEDRFKYIFEAANVGKSITLPSGEMYPNKAFCQMLGYTQEELKGITWQELTVPDEVEEIERMLEPMQKGEKDAARFNKKYIHKDGSLIWADVSLAIRRNSDGTPRHFITTIIDITERKQLEQAVEKARIDFLYAVSHELKTPLHVMRAAQEMIESLPEERRFAQFRDYSDVWRRNLMRLRFIIENLVDSQRLPGMGLKLDKRPANLMDLAREIAAELEPVASARSVQFRFQEGSPPPVPMDRNAFRRLLENLLTNAVKFSRLGGQVEIRWRSEGETVCLDIADSGMGIDPQNMPFLFQPFYRSPEALKAGVQGTGLGLYVSQMIAEAHGGSVGVESEVGKGTTVTVRLPLVEKAQ
jgi:PAS domain S-box-containing protein